MLLYYSATQHDMSKACSQCWSIITPVAAAEEEHGARGWTWTRLWYSVAEDRLTAAAPLQLVCCLGR